MSIKTKIGDRTANLSAGNIALVADRLWRQPPAQRATRIERAKARAAGKHGSRTDAAIAALAG
jgi:hypothetical protein